MAIPVTFPSTLSITTTIMSTSIFTSSSTSTSTSESTPTSSISTSTTSIDSSVSTRTVTVTGPPTSSVGTVSTNSPSVSSTSTSSSSRSLPLGPIIGGILAGLTLILLFLFLLRVLKHRSSQREIRSRAERDTSTPTPFGFNIGERFDGQVSEGTKSITAGLSPPTTGPTVSQVTPQAPNSSSFTPIPSKSQEGQLQYIHQFDERIHLATTYTSYPNINRGHLDGDYASDSVPPAYNSLSPPISQANSSHP